MTEKVPTTRRMVEKRLKKVMKPLSGLDLIRTKLVSEIEVKDGKVKIVIDLPSNHQFANSIREEVVEKIGPLAGHPP